jgi:DNA mismatch endonuclease Vsr
MTKPERRSRRLVKSGNETSSRYNAWPGVPDVRRKIMSAIRSRDTKPEFLVRRLLHATGYRFLVGRRIASHRPDIVFTRRRKAIFVNGCFWHNHEVCRPTRTPKARADYWTAKFEKNKVRDRSAIEALAFVGWETLTVWECELSDEAVLLHRLITFLGYPRWTGSPEPLTRALPKVDPPGACRSLRPDS